MASDTALILQTTAQMFDRMAQRKAQRNIDALRQMQLGMQDRRISMMEEASNLQKQQFEMQKFYNQLTNIEKLTKTQGLEIGNRIISRFNFNEFYNPEDENWAKKYRQLLKGELKVGKVGRKEKVGFGFSDANASLIIGNLTDAVNSKNPNPLMHLVNKVNITHRKRSSGERVPYQDLNLYQGFINMGLFTVDPDTKSVTPTEDMSAIMGSTDNILTNLSKLSQEISEIAQNDFEIDRKFKFLEHTALPSITSTEMDVSEAQKQWLEIYNQIFAGDEEVDSGDIGDVKTPAVKSYDIAQEGVNTSVSKFNFAKGESDLANMKKSVLAAQNRNFGIDVDDQIKELNKVISKNEDIMASSKVEYEISEYNRDISRALIQLEKIAPPNYGLFEHGYPMDQIEKMQEYLDKIQSSGYTGRQLSTRELQQAGMYVGI
jgi:hypothetical protein|tara:strand:+ start:959 stop:2254 length:1296 start_codon:yes stop_codon:yes gene_type:complete